MNFNEFLKQEGNLIKGAKNAHVFRQGDADRSLYLIQSGLLKAYYTSEDGKESVKSFIVPGEIIGSLTSAYSGGTCSFSLLCLEPSNLVKVPFDMLYEYSQKNHEIAKSVIESLLHFSMKKEKREYEFLCLSAEERYRLIAETSPDLLRKVTQNDIARYLGITPVALSRIKKRIS